LAFVIYETNHTEAWLLATEHSKPTTPRRFRSFGFKPPRRQAPVLVGSSKWRVEAMNLKKGDIVKWRSQTSKSMSGNEIAKEHRGTVIGKSVEGLSDDWLHILSFSEGREVVHHISYLIKVEERGA
jgi:hypothetical protein